MEEAVEEGAEVAPSLRSARSGSAAVDESRFVVCYFRVVCSTEEAISGPFK